MCISPFTNCLPILSLSFRVVHDHPLFPPSIVSAAVIAFSFFFFFFFSVLVRLSIFPSLSQKDSVYSTSSLFA